MIRLAHPSDGAAVAAIYNENLGEKGFANCDLEPDTAQRRADHLAHAHARQPTYVLELDGKIQGWAALKEFSARPIFSTIAEIAIYVTMSQRNKFIAAALLDRLVTDAPALGYKYLLAIILHPNSASLRGVQAAGFQPVACLRRAANVRGEWVDIHWLELSLNDTIGASLLAYRSRSAKLREMNCIEGPSPDSNIQDRIGDCS